MRPNRIYEWKGSEPNFIPIIEFEYRFNTGWISKEFIQELNGNLKSTITITKVMLQLRRISHKQHCLVFLSCLTDVGKKCQCWIILFRRKRLFLDKFLSKDSFPFLVVIVSNLSGHECCINVDWLGVKNCFSLFFRLRPWQSVILRQGFWSVGGKLASIKY